MTTEIQNDQLENNETREETKVSPEDENIDPTKVESDIAKSERLFAQTETDIQTRQFYNSETQELALNQVNQLTQEQKQTVSRIRANVKAFNDLNYSPPSLERGNNHTILLHCQGSTLNIMTKLKDNKIQTFIGDVKDNLKDSKSWTYLENSQLDGGTADKGSFLGDLQKYLDGKFGKNRPKINAIGKQAYELVKKDRDDIIKSNITYPDMTPQQLRGERNWGKDYTADIDLKALQKIDQKEGGKQIEEEIQQYTEFIKQHMNEKFTYEGYKKRPIEEQFHILSFRIDELYWQNNNWHPEHGNFESSKEVTNRLGLHLFYNIIISNENPDKKQKYLYDLVKLIDGNNRSKYENGPLKRTILDYLMFSGERAIINTEGAKKQLEGRINSPIGDKTVSNVLNLDKITSLPTGWRENHPNEAKILFDKKYTEFNFVDQEILSVLNKIGEIDYTRTDPVYRECIMKKIFDTTKNIHESMVKDRDNVLETNNNGFTDHRDLVLAQFNLTGIDRKIADMYIDEKGLGLLDLDERNKEIIIAVITTILRATVTIIASAAGGVGGAVVANLVFKSYDKFYDLYTNGQVHIDKRDFFDVGSNFIPGKGVSEIVSAATAVFDAFQDASDIADNYKTEDQQTYNNQIKILNDEEYKKPEDQNIINPKVEDNTGKTADTSSLQSATEKVIGTEYNNTIRFLENSAPKDIIGYLTKDGKEFPITKDLDTGEYYVTIDGKKEILDPEQYPQLKLMIDPNG